MPYEPPLDPRTARRRAIWRWTSFAMVAVLVAVVTYLGYLGVVGSERAAEPLGPSRDCRTPQMAFGWSYQAINYDPDSDAALAALPDALNCLVPLEPAGDEVVTPDGYGIAGWYIPAARAPDPAGPTVVLAHGHGTNKSAMLDYAQVLHEDYNLVLFDFRNHGQSEDGFTTVGVVERGDLRAVIDWLEETKGPRAIGLLGVSMGGATVIGEARGDARVRAVVMDSVHATLANAIQARLERAGYPLALPGAWSILLGGLLRTGHDMSSADPLQAVERYGDRPLLIIAGGRDLTIGPHDAQELLATAREAGVPAELRVCEEAGHSLPLYACPDDYRQWVLGFFERALAGEP